MNIIRYVKDEAPDYDIEGSHDFYYGKALFRAYDVYFNFSKERLLDCQKSARLMHDSSHERTAACMVLYELLKET
jgi:hypothetical protein